MQSFDYQEPQSPFPSPNNNMPTPRISSPIRRRSRASKKAPTTHLNANANNFRALVQQFTGCHTAPPAFTKGPINLNFAHYTPSNTPKYSYQRYYSSHQEHQSFFSFAAANNDIAAAAVSTTTTTADDHEFFVSSTINYNDPTRDPLTLDDFDIDKIPLQEL